MENSLYVAAAAQRTLQKQLITVANNIANSNTVGFRSESVDFGNLVSRSTKEPVHFPTIEGVRPSLLEGAKISTGNPLDLAISGRGWLSISTPAGVAYTRDGRTQISPFGELQSINGYAILDASQAPILLDPQSGPPVIHKDGRIEQNGKIAGNIGVFDIDTKAITGRYSNSAFFTSAPGIAIALGRNITVSQGYVEASNVNPVKELANLITITRNFESAASMVERADAAISKSVNELAGG